MDHREKKKKASTLKKAENRQNEIDRLFAKMYEDRACEKITERNFVMLSSKYQKEQIELEQQITSLREELSKMEQDMIGAEKWIELIKEYSVPKELTAPLLNAMIENAAPKNVTAATNTVFMICHANAGVF